MASNVRRVVMCSSIKHFHLSFYRFALPVRSLSSLPNATSFPGYVSSASRTIYHKDGFPATFGISSLRRWSTETNSKNTPTEENQSASSEEAAGSSASPDFQALEEKNKKLQSQFEETQDKYRRSLAEMENVRQRLNKQVEDAKLFGIQGFCKDLLDVADVLNKATDSVPESELVVNQQLKVLHEGLLLTESQLTKVFTRHGLMQINPTEGDKFDPNFHEALFQQPLVNGKAPGTIATVTKIGYKLHNRTLRPAVVGVFMQS